MAPCGSVFLVTCLVILQFNTVLSQDSNILVWVEDLVDRLKTRGIDEDLFIRSVVGTLNATDPLGGRVTYGIASEDNIFSVDANTGKVSLVKPLDRETKDSYEVTVYARSNNSREITKRYMVTIRDVNDNTPSFTIPEGGYIATVREDALVNSVVLGNIRVTDQDIGVNSEITLDCYVPDRDEGAQRACELFDVSTRRTETEGQYSGSIILSGALDYDRERTHILTLRARDRGDPRRSSFASVTINVMSRQDSVPRFLNLPIIVHIFESIDKDTEVGVLRVQDGARGVSQPLRIKIARGEDGLGWFRLGTPRIELIPEPQYVVPIFSNGNIDREAWDGFYEFDVEAIELVDNRETSSRTRATVRVAIRDRNDNGPEFSRTNYDITVPEGLGAGDQLPGLDMVVKDADLGTNAEFGLNLVDDTWGAFSILQSQCTAECAVSLVVANVRAMDYEDPRYRTQVIKVVARETKTAEQRSSTSTVTVRLRDVNDNAPVFNQTRYSVSVREDQPVGSIIATIQATDTDSGQFGTVRYQLIGLDTGTFSVNEVTGEIRLNRALDYERQPSISLLFEAADQGGRVTRVPFDVTVINFNDQGPVFQNENYDVVVNEGTTTILINITAADREEGTVITYRIVGGNTPDNAFVIDRFTGVVTLRRPLTFADTGGTGTFRLMVEASDGGIPPRRATVPVTITIQDVDDNAPEFERSLYTASVSEIASPGQSVIRVRATDRDTGPNGRFQYTIANGGFGNFDIEPDSGVIRVSRSAFFDRERSPSYRLVVWAVGTASTSTPAKMGITQVIITVTDANNKPPEFIQNVYLTSFLESSPVGTSILQLAATDPDLNSRLEYSLRRETVSAKDADGRTLSPIAVSSYQDVFLVDSRTGVVRIQRRLQRDEVGEVSFVAQVRDVNAQLPSIQTATATVIVTVESDRQEQLEFTPPLNPIDPIIYLNITEEDESLFVYNLIATDPNTNRQVNNYEKVPGTDPMNYFVVERRSGRITFSNRIDYETLSNRQLSFQVRASTTGPDSLSAIVRFIVTILDINDNNPVFSLSSYSFSVPEGGQFTPAVGVFASDADSGEFGRIRYSLSGRGREFFYIDPVQGTITVARNATLDREQVEGGKFNLLVRATDNPNGPMSAQRSTDVPLTIVVTDVNDNRPVFEQSEYNLYTRDSARVGTSVGKVKATDADSSNNGEIVYSIFSGNTDELFVIDRLEGDIRNQRDLRGYARADPYVLGVMAVDRGAVSLSSMATVNIFIRDLQGNDDLPKILFPAVDGVSFPIPENATVGSTITVIRGVARGTSAPGDVFYSFITNPSLTDHTYFRIDPISGEITLARPLDREDRSVYQLIIQVENQLIGEGTKRSIFVNVTDIDDHEPSFLACPGILINPIVVSIPEEEPAGRDVVQVRACDLDAPPNNRTYYYIVKGNSPLPGQDTPPFQIVRSTGQIRTQMKLDRELRKSYTLYVMASSSPDVNVSTVVVNATLGHFQMVRIDLQDVDDNGPSFGGMTTFSTGVVESARFNTPLVKITARDQDSGAASATYALIDTTFLREGEPERSTPRVFVIDDRDGTVRTNINNFTPYQDGYFRMTVIATDENNRNARATLIIYVLRELQRLKFVFNLPPSEVSKSRRAFISEVNNTLGEDIRINDDSVHFSNIDGEMIKSSTDLCFHMVKNNRVVQTEEAFRLLEEKNDELKGIYNVYKVDGYGICAVRVVTYTYSGYEWLWWLLIALTLLIMLVALILICCLCYCWNRYRKKEKAHSPFILLDGEYPAKGYEWQTKTFNMD